MEKETYWRWNMLILRAVLSMPISPSICFLSCSTFSFLTTVLIEAHALWRRPWRAKYSWKVRTEASSSITVVWQRFKALPMRSTELGRPLMAFSRSMRPWTSSRRDSRASSVFTSLINSAGAFWTSFRNRFAFWVVSTSCMLKEAIARMVDTPSIANQDPMFTSKWLEEACLWIWSLTGLVASILHDRAPSSCHLN